MDEDEDRSGAIAAAAVGQAAGQAAGIAAALATGGPRKLVVKAGWKTSEFWITIGLVAGNHLLRAATGIPGPWGLIASFVTDGLAVATYNVSRGMAKR